MSTCVPTTVGATISKIRSIDDKSASSTPDKVIEPLDPSAFIPKSILVPPEASVVTSTPAVVSKLSFP